MMSLVVSYFVPSFSHEMSWMRSGTESSQFLRIILPTLIPLVNFLLIFPGDKSFVVPRRYLIFVFVTSFLLVRALLSIPISVLEVASLVKVPS